MFGFFSEIAQHCVKSVQIRSIPVFSPNAGKYGPEKTPYLDTFQAVECKRSPRRKTESNFDFFQLLPSDYNKKECYIVNIIELFLHQKRLK